MKNPKLLRHHTIYLDARGAATSTLLIADGHIQATGREAIVRAKHLKAQVIKPEGKCIFPTLTDAHAHPWGIGQRANTVDLSHAHDIADILATLKAPTTQPNANGWIIGKQWDQNKWRTTTALSATQLDAIFPDQPVALYRVDHHALWCNSEALRRANIQDGHGLRVDEAMRPVLDAIGPTTPEDDLSTLEKHTQRLRPLGVTCVHQAYMSVDQIQLITNNLDRLRLRIYGMINAKDPKLHTLPGPYHDPEARFSWRTLKYFADGALGSQGALLHEPYLNSTQTGQVVTSAQTLLKNIPTFMNQGWQIAVHAIGDLAATNVLDAYEAASHSDRIATRPRLEHAQMITDHDLKRLKNLNTISSIQPIHFYSDMPWVDKHLNPTQQERLYRWAQLAQESRICAGSDFPIDDPNPWHGISTAITRQARDKKSYTPHQALTIHQILAAYTTGAAHAAHWEDKLGHLHAGAVADWMSLPVDPFHASAQQLWDMQPIHVHCALDTP